MTSLEDFARPGGGLWWRFLGLVLAGRMADLGSTWVATPGLVMEGNPIAKRLGWRWGLAVNLLLAPVAASWPLLAVALSSTSAMVAARNLQSAWLIRSMGETEYQAWVSHRIAAIPQWWALGCHWGESALVGAIGVALMACSGGRLGPFGIGLGLATHAVAVAIYSSLSLWPANRSTR